MQSQKIHERVRNMFIRENLRNHFRPRKLAKVFLHRMQRANAKTQAVKVLRKELVKEESIRILEQILDRC